MTSKVKIGTLFAFLAMKTFGHKSGLNKEKAAKRIFRSKASKKSDDFGLLTAAADDAKMSESSNDSTTTTAAATSKKFILKPEKTTTSDAVTSKYSDLDFIDDVDEDLPDLEIAKEQTKKAHEPAAVVEQVEPVCPEVVKCLPNQL